MGDGGRSGRPPPTRRSERSANSRRRRVARLGAHLTVGGGGAELRRRLKRTLHGPHGVTRLMDDSTRLEARLDLSVSSDDSRNLQQWDEAFGRRGRTDGKSGAAESILFIVDGGFNFHHLRSSAKPQKASSDQSSAFDREPGLGARRRIRRVVLFSALGTISARHNPSPHAR